MKSVLLIVWMVTLGSVAAAEPGEPVRIRNADAVCANLLEARRIAEAQGRLDFQAVVEAASANTDAIAHLQSGPAYAVGRINFTGHFAINDSTLRRAMTLHERDLFDVGRLRRSLARINDLGLAAPLTLADVEVTRRADGATADLTIPLSQRRRRWWSLSGPIIPGLASYEASIASRLPAWGRGVFDASTYVVSFNLLGFAAPLLRVLPFAAKAPAVFTLERPYVPGQGLLSGFALSPARSAGSTARHYGRTHLARAVHALLDPKVSDAMAVPVIGGGRAAGEFVVCTPPKPRLWRLRRGVALASDLALAALLP